jgi:hypothetical protein
MRLAATGRITCEQNWTSSRQARACPTLDVLSVEVESCPLGLGQSPQFGRVPTTSAPPMMLLQKSKVASVRIFGETLKHEAIDDSDNLSRATEVADEFSV